MLHFKTLIISNIMSGCVIDCCLMIFVVFVYICMYLLSGNG